MLPIPHRQTYRQTLKERATQLLIRYKSGALKRYKIDNPILTSDLGLPLTNCALCLEQKFSRAPLVEPARHFH